MSGFRQLLCLCFAGSAIALANGPDLHDVFLSPESRTVSWALGDFNGDNRIDLATAHSSQHDTSGYAQEVRVDLGDVPQHSFAFHSPFANVRLAARDIDGDHDRDIVVLEPRSTEAIGVWLNDGDGNFEESDFVGLGAASRDSDAAAFDRSDPRVPAVFAIQEQQPQPAAIAASIGDAVFAAARTAPAIDSARKGRSIYHLRPRAPPYTS